MKFFLSILTQFQGAAALPVPAAKHHVEAAPEVAEAFFREPRNFAGKSLEDIFAILGKPADYDDWDWGRLNYNWRSADRCVRIYTKGSSLECVVLMEPVNTPRDGPALEVIWAKPDQ